MVIIIRHSGLIADCAVKHGLARKPEYFGTDQIGIDGDNTAIHVGNVVPTVESAPYNP